MAAKLAYFSLLSTVFLNILAAHKNTRIEARYQHTCTESKLYKPYLHVYDGMKGSKILDKGPGFVDFVGKNNIYMCINGPAYLYFSFNTSLGEVYDAPEWGVHIHLCGLYNKPPRKGRELPPNARKLHAVLLVGHAEDYRRPSIQLFTAPTFNYGTNNYENGTSVIVFGHRDCILVKNGVLITIKPNPPANAKNPEYCFRQFNLDGADKDEENALRADSPIAVIECDPDPTADYLTSTTAKPPVSSAASASPEPDTGTESDDSTATETGSTPASALATPSTKSPAMLPITIPVTTCTPLPTLEDECNSGKPDKIQACNIFKSMFANNDMSPSGLPTFSPKQAWKQEVIELIGEIYIQTCPILNSRFAKLVNRIFMHYLITSNATNNAASAAGAAAGSAGEGTSDEPATPAETGSSPPIKSVLTNAEAQRPHWIPIVEELKECLETGKQLYFKDQIVNGIRSQVFYKNGQHPMTLTHLEEAAELEYEFNWVIDMHWRIFATVLGICTSSSSANIISSFFYSLYVEDTFNAVNNTWIRNNDNQIFEVTLAEFYGKEGERWADYCLEAAFIESDSQKYRPIRPLLVGDFQQDNHFTNADEAAEGTSTTVTTRRPNTNGNNNNRTPPPPQINPGNGFTNKLPNPPLAKPSTRREPYSNSLLK